ncbi:hypothetical protein EJB05_04668, partial [Eragrostis curvula]
MERERRMDPALFKAATQGKVWWRRTPGSSARRRRSSTRQPSALHLAALHGHADFAGEVLERNEDLLVARNDDGDTPLRLAAKSGKLEVAKLLVGRAVAFPPDQKSPLIMTNKAGNSPLHEAVHHRRGAVAVALLGADPWRGHDLNEQMESPLHMAALEGLANVVQKIVDHAWVDQEFLPSLSLSGTALHQAVLGGHIRIVEILLDKRPELIDLTDSDGNNALHYAAQKNHPRAVEMLLSKHLELAYKRNLKNQSTLHVAAHYGSTDAIMVLLRHCPDVAEMVDSYGGNAFHSAVTGGKLNAVKCLIRHVRPAELLNRVDLDGNTPLHLAVKMGRISSALMLLKDRRVDPCVRDRDGQTACSLVEMKLHTGEMDAYETYLWEKLKQQESKRCRKQQLSQRADFTGHRSFNDRYFERVIETYILVATVIATANFAATFTMPGGYDQSKGIALHGHNTAFKIFIISNGIAMCASIVLIFCMVWVWQSPDKFRIDQLLWGHRLTVLAVLAMLVSFMTAVYITVAPTQPWPAYVVIAMGAVSPVLVVLIVGGELIVKSVNTLQ